MNKLAMFFTFILLASTAFSQKCLNAEADLQWLRGYHLNKDSLYRSNKKEFEFIEIKKHDTIADIGSFNGYHPLVYSVFSDSCVFYLNDIQQDGFAYYDSIKNVCEQIRGHSFTNKFSIVIGNDTNTKLPDHLFNIVLVREALHHFKMKDKMLMDIKRIMNPRKEARLILDEPIIGQTKKENLCPGAMTRDDLLALLDKNGFSLSTEILVGDRSWFEFVLKEKK
jgi:hypothetical protein